MPKDVDKLKISWAKTGKKKQKDDRDKHSYFSTYTRSESLCHIDGREGNLLRRRQEACMLEEVHGSW